MSNLEEKLEGRVADMFGYPAAVFSGRARSGLLALLRAIGLRANAPVLIPSNICPDLVLALHANGHPIRLVPVSPLNGLASDEAFVAAMEAEVNVGLVMPTHLYGFLQDYPGTIRAARAKGWFILENDTLAVRCSATDSSKSPFGDALLVSFGHAKTIEAGGGGAILLKDKALEREIRGTLKTYPVLDEEAIRAEQEFGLLARELRNRRLAAKEKIFPVEQEAILMKRAPGAEFAFQKGLLPALSDALDRLPALLSRRFEVQALWDNALRPFGDLFTKPRADMKVPWRLIRRVPKGRMEILTALRSAGIDVGTNYPSLTDSFPVLFKDQHHADADQWGREVINFWLTPDYDRSRIEKSVRILSEVTEKL